MLVWMGFLATAAAEEEAFNPDRPGFADSTGAIPRGRLMTELGASLATSDGDASINLPNLLIRGGLGSGLELRVAAPNLAFPLSDASDAGDAGDAGDADASVGGTALGLKAAGAIGPVALSVVGTAPITAATTLADGFGAPIVGVNVSGGVGDLNLVWTLNTFTTFSEGLSWAGGAAVSGGLGARGGAYAQVAVDAASSPLVGVGGTFVPLDAFQLDLSVDYFPFVSDVLIGVGIARQW